MRAILRAFRFLLAPLGALAALPAYGAAACECRAEEVFGRFEAADLVFAGLITEVNGNGKPEWQGRQAPRAALRVEQSWKGRPGTVIRVMVADPCDPPVVIGRNYLVYASRLYNGELVATQECSFQSLSGFDSARERRRLDRLSAPVMPLPGLELEAR